MGYSARAQRRVALALCVLWITKDVARVTRGAISLSNSNHFPAGCIQTDKAAKRQVEQRLVA
jgi:hypothetical protein